MPMVSYRKFLFDCLGYEGAIVFGEPHNDLGQPGCMVKIYTETKDPSQSITRDNFTTSFDTAWNVWISGKELIELGHYMIKMGILSTEADGEPSDE